jgi:hypothetical protein
VSPWKKADLAMLLGLVVLIGGANAVGYFALRKRDAARRCLERLVRAAAGSLPVGEARCPVSDRPYPAPAPFRCPDPGEHLPTSPQFGPRGVSQTFPPPSPATERSAPGITAWFRFDGARVDRLPRAWWSFLGGPLLLLLGLASLLVILANLARALRRRPREAYAVFMHLVGMGLVAYLSFLVIRSSWGRETWTFDRTARSVTYERRIAGIPWGGPTTHRDPRAFVPVRSRLFLVAADGSVHSLLEVRPDDLGALAPLLW